MNKNTKLRDLVKKMIAEAVSHRIQSIDEAGDVAANEAKITRLDEELKKASKIAELLEKVNLQHYIGEKLYSKVKEEMAKSIQEYEDAKMQLEEKKSSEKTAMKKVEKKDDKEGKEKVLESKSRKLNENTNKKMMLTLAKPEQIEKFFKKHGKKPENNVEKKDEMGVYDDYTYDGENIKYYYRLGRLDYPKDGSFAQLIQKERPFPQI
jgi:predicted phage tail protein